MTLFEFGRTLWCRCGHRVGIEPRRRALHRPSEPRFAADAMLGRLARWLRILGFDCTYDADIEDEALVRLALEEARTLLTRDRRLPEEWWVEDVYLVEAERVREQLAEVVGRFGLGPRIRLLSRCSRCNHALRTVAPEAVRERVPERSFRHYDDFAECSGCGHVYWEGSHAERIRALVQELVAQP